MLVLCWIISSFSPNKLHVTSPVAYVTCFCCNHYPFFLVSIFVGFQVAQESPKIEFHMDPRHFEMEVAKAYMYVSGKLLNLMMDSEHLVAKLRSIRHFFLLDQDDFIAEFLRFALDQLEQPVAKVNKSAILSSFDDAVRSSALNADPHKSMMRWVPIQVSDHEEMTYTRYISELHGLVTTPTNSYVVQVAFRDLRLRRNHERTVFSALGFCQRAIAVQNLDVGHGPLYTEPGIWW